MPADAKPPTDAGKKKGATKGAKKKSAKRSKAQRFATHPAVWMGLVIACVLGGVGWLVAGCGDWSPSEPWTRHAPEVDRAIELYDAGQFESAEEALQTYLGTGPCADGSIGLPPKVRERPNGSFDLGLTLFALAEKYGTRFGEETVGDAGAEDPEQAELRSLEIDCAQIIAKAIASDTKVPADLRARAYYLSGNLEFLRKEYEAAVAAYDQALEIVPGVYPEAGGDEIGRDAAWNRAIALRRLQEEEEQDAGDDADPDSGEDEPDSGEDEPDAGEDSGDEDSGDEDAGDDAGEDGGDQDAGDDGGEDGGEPDAGDDAGQDGGDEQESDGGQDGGEDEQQQPQPDPDSPEEGDPPPPSNQSQMERMLDELEEAPTYQEEDAKRKAAQGRRRPVMEDK